MIKPPEPENEMQRIKALHSLNILDTQSEERFDRVTRVIQNLFNVPIASVSFVDSQREWYKSRFGLEFEETPREISFGGHVILEQNIMIVKDTASDIRFKDNPLVVGEPDIRYYLGCPLTIKGQFNIGTLCLIDHKVQQFNTFDIDIIKELAATVENEFYGNSVSTIDEFTQLSNHEGIILIGRQIIKRCNQYDKGVLLLYFNLNNLKQINDNFGQEEANKILKIFSQQLLKNFRKTDAIARLGEDRFCVLCSGMRQEHLPIVIRRFENKLAKIKTNHPIDFNLGTIKYDRRRHHSIYSLVEEADEKTYEYKRHPHAIAQIHLTNNNARGSDCAK